MSVEIPFYCKYCDGEQSLVVDRVIQVDADYPVKGEPMLSLFGVCGGCGRRGFELGTPSEILWEKDSEGNWNKDYLANRIKPLLPLTERIVIP